MAAVTSVRQNSQPVGGMSAQQPVPATPIPGDVAGLTEQIPQDAVVRFRQQSTAMRVALADMPLTIGQQQSIRIANVGLGYRVVTKHTAVFSITNANVGAQTLTLGRTFPWSCIQDTTIQINGGATIYTASGYGGLLVAGRNRQSFFSQAALAGTQVGLPTPLVTVTLDASLTPTAGGTRLGGITSLSVAGSTTSKPLTVVWYTFEKLAFSRDTLLGALPLQNNSTFATLSRTFASSGNLIQSGAKDSAPFSNLGADITISLGSYVANSWYEFWSVPSDPGLYAAMIGNSYQVNQQRSIGVSATGPQALQYNVPQNNYLTTLHVIGVDTNNNFLVPKTNYSFYRVQYNAGSVIPIFGEIGMTIAEQYMDLGYNTGDLPGYLLWDGNDTTEDITATDDAGWIDAYSVASPQFMADLSGSAPFSFDIVRESVVAGSVNVVAG